MDRREFLTLSAGALAAGATVKPGFAQAQAPAAAPAAAPVAILPRTPGVPADWKNHLDAYSRTLHWCKTPGEVAQACHEIGNTTIDLTVRNVPAHVQPEKVRTDLPIWYNALKREGITITKIGMDINDVNTPHVEAMLDTASSLGVFCTWWRGPGALDYSQGYQKGLDAQKARTEPLAKMLEKYRMKACYHPGGFPEIFDLVRAFDPRYIALSYDTGNMGQYNQNMLANQIRMAGPWVGSVVFKENYILSPGAPPYTPPPGVTPGPGTVPDAPAEGRGGAGGRAGAAAPAAGQAAGEAPAGRGGGRGGGGRGGAAAAPGGGRGGASANGYSQRQVPLGTGILNLPLICQALKEINFQGPIECQPEWPELGGPGSGSATLTKPRADVIAMLRRDFVTVSTPLAAAGVI